MFSGLSWLKYAAPFLAGVGAMWLYHSAAVSDMEADVAKGLQKQAEQSQLDAWVLQQRVIAIDAKHTKELSDAQEVSRQLSADLAAGRKRLSVAATCKPLPEAASAGVGNGGIAILDRIAEQAYSDHRALIEKKDAQIRALQAILKGSR
jgi:prophage endopeptidase